MICRACASTCPCGPGRQGTTRTRKTIQQPVYKTESEYSPTSEEDMDSDFEPIKWPKRRCIAKKKIVKKKIVKKKVAKKNAPKKVQRQKQTAPKKNKERQPQRKVVIVISSDSDFE